jgi:sugar O-acyltransferase (sialic acid O-acetyltransferase NeuD family)
MSKPIVLLGYGGHGKVLLDSLLILGVEMMAVVDPALRQDQQPDGIPLWANDEAIMALAPEDILLVNGIGSVRSCAARDAIFQRFRERGFGFASVIHPSAIISPRTILGAGCQVMAGAVVQAGTRLDDNCIINTRASVDHDCIIGRSVHVAPGAVLCGSVTVGEQSHIGSGAIVIQGITINPGSLVPAGSVVTHSPGDTRIERQPKA